MSSRLHPPPLILANWKMNLSVQESAELARQLVRGSARARSKYDLVLCPTFPALSEVSRVIKDKGVFLGAQNIFWKSAGPYTGEVSAKVLQELGVSHVIIGHSERRQYLNETDSMVHQKVAACLSEGLVPVLCVGETFTERQQGQKNKVIERQIISALQGISITSTSTLVIAYEPVWVIGSGQAVSPDEANHTAKGIYNILSKIISSRVINKQCRIIYGGSVDIINISGFLKSDLISGALVGGASLDAKRFNELLKHL